ncbi:hypothetical protein RRG08_062476 [Elysia crispata]|uniref:Uncharacterized protein n=1 Tax=Elysia crispata TaxID=231223 RepID=A0AAE1D5M9_9GAST|nr:hypothetical protein RRG08_062476 [Elysia crispata]
METVGSFEKYVDDSCNSHSVAADSTYLQPQLSTWHNLQRAPTANPHNLVACLRFRTSPTRENKPKKNKYCPGDAEVEESGKTTTISNEKQNANLGAGKAGKAEQEAELESFGEDELVRRAEPPCAKVHPASPVPLSPARHPQVYFYTVRRVRPATGLLVRFPRSYREFLASLHRLPEPPPERSGRNHGE